MSTTEKAVETENYDELGVSELAKKVNDAYYQIYSHDRADYPRAVMVGEMLNNLKPRVTKHGGWQKWLKENCPKISYETANIYMRISDPDNQKKILAEAAAKNVAATDLTIAFARNVLNPPKPEKDKEAKAKEKAEKERKEKDKAEKEKAEREKAQQQSPSETQSDDDGGETDDGEYNANDLAVGVTPIAAEEVFPLLKDWDVDELRKLHALIGERIATLGKQSEAQPTASQIAAGAAGSAAGSGSALNRRV